MQHLLPAGRRLDSWKAIASYLNRDLANGSAAPALDHVPAVIQWWPWLLIGVVACAFIVGFVARS